jgi:y4mF family transcriptional regulator
MRRKLDDIKGSVGPIAWFVRVQRNGAGLTQEELAMRAGVGARFLKELELGKPSLRLDKVQQVLQFFGHELTASPLPEDRR